MMRRARALQVLSSLGIVWMLSACGIGRAVEGGPSDYFFPTWPLSAGDMVPDGRTSGNLVARNGCLFLDASEQESLLLWPSVFTLSGTDSPIVTSNRGDELHVDDVVILGGGERSREQAEDLIGGPIPNRCTAQGYWLVSSIVSVQPNGS